ncbi:hypothetical protein D1872_205180 [compost metagenome]
MTARRIIALTALILAIVFLVSYSIPFILALFTALLLEPLVVFLVNKGKMRRMMAVTISFLLLCCLVGGSVYWLGTTLVV